MKIAACRRRLMSWEIYSNLTFLGGLLRERFAFAGDAKLTDMEVHRLIGILNSCLIQFDDDGNEYENEDVKDAMKYLQSKLREAGE